MDEIILLNRIRVDIGNVSGSLSELMQYAGMAGFNDNYEPQTKPRLVGTWTINDWYTATQLVQAQAAFDGLTIVEDPNYRLDFSQMAVQVLDPNEDNYNPAVAIILQGQNLGTTMTNALFGYGRWFMTKSQAAAVTSIGTWFSNKTTITDANSIVSNFTQTYDFESFNELIYFTSVISTVNRAFNGCAKLKEINLSNVTTLGGAEFLNCTDLTTIAFNDTLTVISDTLHGTASLLNIIYPSNIKKIGDWNGTDLHTTTELPDTIEEIIGNGLIYSKISLSRLPSNIKSISNNGLRYCNNLTFTEIPASIESIGSAALAQGANFPYMHVLKSTPFSVSSDSFYGSYKIYVGDGSSAAHDDAILQAYLADTNWSSYSSRLDTWYNYLHPTT